jgi:hypothetical protein
MMKNWPLSPGERVGRNLPELLACQSRSLALSARLGESESSGDL